MAVFSRRSLQRLLCENSEFLTETQTARHVAGLNEGDLGVEWEVVLLNVLNHMGKLSHESNFRLKAPDIFYQGVDGLDFIADIRTVSDRHVDDANPIERIKARLDEI
jgi:hypothetical protein